MIHSIVVLRSIDDIGLERAVTEILDVLNLTALLPPNGKVVVKLNLNSPYEDHLWRGANTSVELIAAVCNALKRRTNNILLGDSDGTRFKSEEVVALMELRSALEPIGVEVVNFSNLPSCPVDLPLLEDFELPEIILDADLFVTLPVLKTHGLTAFTGALKNQWGAIPRYDRMLLHKNIHKLTGQINAVLKPRLAIMDAITAMEGRGPCNGNPRKLNLILGSRDLAALDATAMRLVGLDPTTAKHVCLAHEQGVGTMNADEIEIDGDFDAHQTRFTPAPREWPTEIMNYMSRYPWFLYNVILSDDIFWPVRKLVHAMRRWHLTGG